MILSQGQSCRNPSPCPWRSHGRRKKVRSNGGQFAYQSADVRQLLLIKVALHREPHGFCAGEAVDEIHSGEAGVRPLAPLSGLVTPAQVREGDPIAFRCDQAETGRLGLGNGLGEGASRAGAGSIRGVVVGAGDRPLAGLDRDAHGQISGCWFAMWQGGQKARPGQRRQKRSAATVLFGRLVEKLEGEVGGFCGRTGGEMGIDFSYKYKKASIFSTISKKLLTKKRGYLVIRITQRR